ncbi:MAG TPA: transcription termination/antitermination NusG family protein [Verrucomicrobiae bacterium]|nr:transcription termination/antitermination NusG family protein [Verrucomicrobiae bacterium]
MTTKAMARKHADEESSLPNLTRWLCVHTRPRKESAAEQYCRDVLHLDTYYPKLKRLKTIRRVKRWVTGPLFPRYFFCKLNLAHSFRAVRYSPQVIDVVSFGGKPTVVDDAIIHQLRQWAGETVDVIIARPALKPGDPVQIVDGPLRGLQAVVVQETSDRDRVAVLLSTLQYQARVVVSRSQLENS